MTVDFNALRKPRTVTKSVEGVGDCTFRIMTGAMRQKYADNMLQLREKYKSDDQIGYAMLDIKSALIAITLVDTEGAPVFTSKDDVGDLLADTIDALYDAALDANGMSESARERAEKN